MFEALMRFFESIPGLLAMLFNNMVKVSAISAEFVRNTARAHFNLLGQYTAPLEQELLDTDPDKIPQPSQLNILGQIALTIIPVTILSWLASLTIVPLLYNSIKMLIKTFKKVTNLALFDLPVNEKFSEDQNSTPWYNLIYSLPGLFLGLFIGAISFTAILLFRAVTNTFKNLVSTFVSVFNIGLVKSKLAEPEFESSHPLFKALGVLGYVFGFAFGIIGLGFAGFSLLIINSWKTALRFVGSAINLIRKQKIDTNLEVLDERPPVFKGLGIPGYFFGFIPALLGFTFASIERTFIESWKTLQSTFLSGLNLALHKDNARTIFDEKQDNIDYYFFGFLGHVLGFIGGTLGFGTVGLGRMLSNSYLSFLHMFYIFTNTALHKNDESELYGLSKDDRRPLYRIGLGWGGLVLGAIVGSFSFATVLAGRILINSWKTALQTVGSAVNLIRKNKVEYNLETIDQREPKIKFGLGGLGLVLGFIPGLIGYAVALIEYSVIESWKTFQLRFISGLNLALHKNDAIAFVEEKQNNIDYYFFGFPGHLLGVISGSVGFIAVGFGRMLNNSYLSFLHMFAIFTNTALDKNDEITRYGLGKDDRRPLYRIGLGAAGLVLGAFVGIFGFTAALAGRVLTNSWKTGLQMVGSAINLIRKSKVKNDLETEDGRQPKIRYGLGWPGLLFGLIPAGFGFTGAFIERSLIESWKSLVTMVEIIINVILPEKIPQQKIKRELLDKILAFPGSCLGVFVGAIGFFGIGFVRTITNSAASFLSMARVITNAALEEEIKLSEETRTPFEIYGFGGLGLGFGIVAGGIGFTIAGIGQVLIHSWKTMVELTLLSMNVVRKKTISLDLDDLSRNKFKKYYIGSPGLFLGLATGALGFVAACFERAVHESWETTKLTFNTIVNIVLVTERKSDHIEKDKVDRWFFGASGILAGAIAGGVGFVSIAVYRTVINSAKSFVHMFATVVNFALDPNQQFETVGLDKDIDRLPKETFGFGAVGIAAGALVGSFGYVVVGFGQIIIHSINSGKRIFTSLINIGSVDEPRLSSEGLEENDDRHWALKYVVGIPGLLTGAFAGIVALSSIYAAKFIHHNYRSYIALSGSILNVALGRVVFGGLASDTRDAYGSGAGFIGYLAATLTIPVALVVFFGRVMIPTVFALALGVLGSILVAPMKWYRMIQEPRFDATTPSTDPKMQNLKNLYSTLDAWGNFPEDQPIIINGKGNKGSGTFIRKALTFDQPSMTEMILDALLKECQGHLNTLSVRETVEAYYEARVCCAQNPEAIALQKQQINDIVSFIEDYLAKDPASQVKVPDGLYSQYENGFANTFFGIEKKVASVKASEPRADFIV